MLLQMALFHSFLWISNISLYIYITSSLSIHLLMDIMFFHVLAIVNSAAMNVGVGECFFLNYSFSLDICPGVGLQDHQFSSVTPSCLTLCDPLDCSMPGFPVHHQLLGPTQTHVHLVSDAIQPSHSLSSPFPFTFNLSQHQGLFK